MTDNETDNSTPDTSQPRKKSTWRKILKISLWTVTTLILLIIAAISLILFYLTPERLTGLVNRYAGEFLDADIHVERVELTFWSTFPRFNLDVRKLNVVSHSLRSLPAETRATLPADADSLLSLEKFSGGIHILNLLKNEIDLYDVEFLNPKVNLIVVNDSINNFNILPPSEPSTEPIEIPRISINRFEIGGMMPIHFRIPKDSIDLTLTLSRTKLGGTDAPAYTIGMSGTTSAELADLKIPSVPFALDGSVDWDLGRPQRIGLRDFTFTIINIPVNFSSQLNLADTLTVDSLSIAIGQCPLGKLIEYAPEKLTQSIKGLETDISLTLDGRLTRPYRIGIDSLPSVDGSLRASATRLKYEDLNLHYLDLDMTASVCGNDLDRSTIDIRRLATSGRAAECELKATVTHPISDPRIDARFNGLLTLDALPSKLLDRLPMTLCGTLKGNARARLRLSDLTPKNFYHANIDGELTLTGFHTAMRDGSMDASINKAQLSLGTSSRRSVGDHLIDSLLTSSLTIDTATVNAPGINLTGSRLSLNVGMRNTATSADTSQINPIGATLRAGRLTLLADSGTTDLRLRDATLRAVLTRYNSEARSPLLSIDIEAQRMGGRTPDLAGGIMGAKASLTLHPRARRPLSAKMQTRVDSLAAIHPDLSTDSLISLARRQTRRNHDSDQSDGKLNIDMKVDNSLASWLKLWQVSGSLKAERGGLFTPLFPTRTSLSDLSMTFSTDSVVIHNAAIRAGQSDFNISGSIRNIRRALTSRRHQPIEIAFNIASDIIDVNDLTATLMRGAADSTRGDDVRMDLIADGNVELAQTITPSSPTPDETAEAPLLIPSNVKAELNIHADRLLYNDLLFKDFTGTTSIYDGAIALDRLHALTDMGQVDMTALYSAPTAADLRFAAGINLRHLDLKQLLQQMPHIDSLMPMLREVEGIVDAQLALTTELDSLMNIRFNTLDMALRLSGKDLVLLDSETFRTVAKWMLFKNKKRNMIDRMDVEVTVHDGWLDLYPVIFDIDRYRLGVVGNNDMNFNLDYHVAVLKSPIPFKFGINIKGTPGKMKIRPGRSRINEKTAATSRHLTDSIRVNLIREIGNSFRRGLRSAGAKGLKMQQLSSKRPTDTNRTPDDDELSPADSAVFIKEGLIEAPEGYIAPGEQPASDPADKKKKKKQQQ